LCDAAPFFTGRHGRAKKDYEAAIASLKWESIEFHEWPGFPSAEDIKALEERGAEPARLVKGI
jgi:hypothetical protein